MVKFSLIVPVYNVEEYLERCVDSILNQTYINFELILVDDGSIDNSGKMCDNFAKNDSRIKAYHKKNGGLSDARNFGLKCAKGEFVWFIDSDDYINTKALEKIENHLNSKSDFDVILFDYFRDNNGVITKYYDRFDWRNDKEKILYSCSACTKIFRRSFLYKNDFWFLKGKIYEDLELIPYLISKTKKISFVDEGLYYYFVRNDSIMNQRRFNIKFDDKFFVLDSLKNRFFKDDSYKKYKEEIEYLYIRHLIFVYSCEIIKFDKNVYKVRFNKVLTILNDLNDHWYSNKYLLSSPFTSKFFCFLFRKKKFVFCKLLLKISGKI